MLAAFFKDMVIRHIIIGINLQRYKSWSTTHIMRAEVILHPISPVDAGRRKAVSQGVIHPSYTREGRLHYR